MSRPLSVAKYGESRRKADKVVSRGKIDSVNLIIRESNEVTKALKRQR